MPRFFLKLKSQITPHLLRVLRTAQPLQQTTSRTSLPPPTIPQRAPATHRMTAITHKLAEAPSDANTDSEPFSYCSALRFKTGKAFAELDSLAALFNGENNGAYTTGYICCTVSYPDVS